MATEQRLWSETDVPQDEGWLFIFVLKTHRLIPRPVFIICISLLNVTVNLSYVYWDSYFVTKVHGTQINLQLPLYFVGWLDPELEQMGMRCVVCIPGISDLKLQSHWDDSHAGNEQSTFTS